MEEVVSGADLGGNQVYWASLDLLGNQGFVVFQATFPRLCSNQVLSSAGISEHYTQWRWAGPTLEFFENFKGTTLGSKVLRAGRNWWGLLLLPLIDPCLLRPRDRELTLFWGNLFHSAFHRVQINLTPGFLLVLTLPSGSQNCLLGPGGNWAHNTHQIPCSRLDCSSSSRPCPS